MHATPSAWTNQRGVRASNIRNHRRVPALCWRQHSPREQKDLRLPFLDDLAFLDRVSLRRPWRRRGKNTLDWLDSLQLHHSLAELRTNGPLEPLNLTGSDPASDPSNQMPQHSLSILISSGHCTSNKWEGVSYVPWFGACTRNLISYSARTMFRRSKQKVVFRPNITHVWLAQ